MSDKQTTAFILILLSAFIFWSYNKKTATGNLLGDIVNNVTGKVGTSTSTSTSDPEANEAEQAAGGIPTYPGLMGGPPLVNGKIVPGQASAYHLNYNAVAGSNGQFLTPVLNATSAYGLNGLIMPVPVGQSGSIGDV